MTDIQYIEAIANGNNVAFTELYEEYRSEFINYVRKSYKGNEVIIFDLYQDSCVALYDNICTGKLSTSSLKVKLKTYLFQIGHYKLVDLYRRGDSKFKARFVENIDYAQNCTSEYSDECSEREAIIRQAVNTMSEPCNSILTLYYWEDKSMKEIADELQYSCVDSAKSQKSKCMSKLKAYIKAILA